MIPFNKPTIGTEEEQALLRVLHSGHWTSGKEVIEFEKEFADYIGAPYVIAVDNCTNALFLALKFQSYNPLKKLHVKCPAMTFASVAHVIDQNDFLIDFTDEYHAGVAYQLGNTNIWDCAHEIKKFIPGQVMCYSFYPNKVLSSCEGGVIATDDKNFAEWAKLARANGRLSRTFSDYDIVFRGWKMNMTDMQAALAREQLKKLDGFFARREQIKSRYAQEFTQINKGNYLYVILVENREEFMTKMLENDIELSYHYKPLYDQQAYENFKGNFPYLESIKNKIITLPLYPSMTDEEVEKVIRLTKQYAKT